MLYMDINKTAVRRINKALPRGSQTRIAAIVKKSRQHVSLVLTGSMAVTEDNYCIIQEAQKIVEETKKQKKKSERAIKKLLSA